MDAAAHSSIIQGQNPGYRVGRHGAPRVLPEGKPRGVGRSSRSGAGARSSSSVPRAAVSVLGERGRPSLSERKSGHQVGLGIRHEGFVRNTAPEVSGHALPVPSIARSRARGLWLAPKRSMPHAEPGAEATRVKNEGAFPFADARTYRVEEGSDEDTFCHLPIPRGTGKVVGSLG
jgi:hypothetical protein